MNPDWHLYRRVATTCQVNTYGYDEMKVGASFVAFEAFGDWQSAPGSVGVSGLFASKVTQADRSPRLQKTCLICAFISMARRIFYLQIALTRTMCPIARCYR